MTRTRSSSNFLCSGSIEFELPMLGFDQVRTFYVWVRSGFEPPMFEFDRVRTSHVWVRSGSNFLCSGSIGFELPMFGFDRVRTRRFEFEFNRTSNSSLNFESSFILSNSNSLSLGHVYPHPTPYRLEFTRKLEKRKKILKKQCR